MKLKSTITLTSAEVARACLKCGSDRTEYTQKYSRPDGTVARGRKCFNCGQTYLVLFPSDSSVRKIESTKFSRQPSLALAADGTPLCPSCRSPNVKPFGSLKTRIGDHFRYHRCGDCGTECRSINAPKPDRWARRRAVQARVREKTCNVCKTKRPITDFLIAGVKKRQKELNAARVRPESRLYRPVCKPCRTEQHFEWQLSQYKLTRQDYDRILSEQGGGCAICKRPHGATRGGKPLRLFLDHCHKTGEFRALLCSGCNTALGCFRDDPDLMRAGAEYVERHAAKSERG